MVKGGIYEVCKIINLQDSSAINKIFNLFGILTLREKFRVLHIFLGEICWWEGKARSPLETVFLNISSQIIHIYQTCHLFYLIYYMTYSLYKTSTQFNKSIGLNKYQNTLDYLLLKGTLNKHCLRRNQKTQSNI